jgi:hypothetical protein
MAFASNNVCDKHKIKFVPWEYRVESRIRSNTQRSQGFFTRPSMLPRGQAITLHRVCRPDLATGVTQSAGVPQVAVGTLQCARVLSKPTAPFLSLTNILQEADKH